MENGTFMLLNEEEKQTKLRSALNNKTGGNLTEEELNSIVHAISLRRQYAIQVYHNYEEFRYIYEKTVPALRQALLDTESTSCILQAAAFVTRDAGNLDGINKLHIFIPVQRLQKGIYRNESQRMEAACCI